MGVDELKGIMIRRLSRDLMARWREWYEIYGCLLLKAVLIPLVLIACACSGVGILMLPVLFWLGRDRVMD
jgi:hypothetical protein